MKKNLFALIFIMCVGIVVSFGICDNKESNLNFMEGNGEQIIVEVQKILKEKKEDQDEAIKKLITQIDANLAEGYWLFGFDAQHRPVGKTYVEIYVDNLEEIGLIALISPSINTDSNTGVEQCYFYTTVYAVSEGNSENLFAFRQSYSNSLEEAREVLEIEESITQKEYIYVDTMETHEWPQPKHQDYRIEELKSTDIYQNFDVLIRENGGFYFSPETEVYLGLWNGYSKEVRMMYAMKAKDGNTYYYMVHIGLDGSIRGYINQYTEEIYERFKMISVKMKEYEKED